MKRTEEGWLAWQRWPQALEECWRKATSATERATAVAELLAETVPAELIGCRLDGPDGSAVTVRLGSTAEQAAALQALTTWLPNEAEPAWPPELAELEPLTAALATGGNVRGLLLAVPRRRRTGVEKAALPALLSLIAHALALRLELDAVRAECASLEEPALIGEAAGALTHDLNNHLNGMVLQAAIVQTKVEEPLRDMLMVIRQSGVKASALLRPIVEVRVRRRERRLSADLNAEVRRVAVARGLRAELGDALPSLTADPVDVRRLVELLAGLASERLPATLRTGAEGQAVFLLAEGGAREEDASVADLHRLALRSLVRQTGARLEIVRPNEVFRVIWGGEGGTV
jgi:hypothetical protein